VLPILQSLWEEHDSGSRLAMVNPYFLGSDIPQSISKPCVEEDEVSQLTIVMKLETIAMFTFHKYRGISPVSVFLLDDVNNLYNIVQIHNY